MRTAVNCAGEYFSLPILEQGGPRHRTILRAV